MCCLLYARDDGVILISFAVTIRIDYSFLLKRMILADEIIIIIINKEEEEIKYNKRRNHHFVLPLS